MVASISRCSRFLPCPWTNMASEQHRPRVYLLAQPRLHVPCRYGAGRVSLVSADKGGCQLTSWKKLGRRFVYVGRCNTTSSKSIGSGHVVSESAGVAMPCACLQLKTASTVPLLSALGQTFCCPGMVLLAFCIKKTPIYVSER